MNSGNKSLAIEVYGHRRFPLTWPRVHCHSCLLSGVEMLIAWPIIEATSIGLHSQSMCVWPLSHSHHSSYIEPDQSPSSFYPTPLIAFLTILASPENILRSNLAQLIVVLSLDFCHIHANNISSWLVKNSRGFHGWEVIYTWLKTKDYGCGFKLPAMAAIFQHRRAKKINKAP